MRHEHSDRHLTQLGSHDVYLIDQPAILSGDQLDRLSLTLRVPGLVHPPQLVHQLVNQAAYEPARTMVNRLDSPHARPSAE